VALIVAGSAVRLSPGFPASVKRVVGAALRGGDVRDGGAYRVAGTVAISGTPDTPVRRQVRLFSKREARLVREVWSDAATGAYSFDNIKYQSYFVVAHDYLTFYNAVIKDAINPEPMP
jgi:hypothetical protein